METETSKMSQKQVTPCDALVGLSYDGQRVVCAGPKVPTLDFDGRIILLRGANGAGKTTMLRWLYQHTPATMLSAELEFPKHLRPAAIEKLYGSATRHSILDTLIPEDRPWIYLSAGNRQKTKIRTVLRAALAHATERKSVVLLDEPSIALDEDSQRWLWSILVTLAQRHPATLKVIVATHDRDIESTYSGHFETWHVATDSIIKAKN